MHLRYCLLAYLFISLMFTSSLTAEEKHFHREEWTFNFDGTEATLRGLWTRNDNLEEPVTVYFACERNVLAFALFLDNAETSKLKGKARLVAVRSRGGPSFDFNAKIFDGAVGADLQDEYEFKNILNVLKAMYRWQISSFNIVLDDRSLTLTSLYALTLSDLEKISLFVNICTSLNSQGFAR